MRGTRSGEAGSPLEEPRLSVSAYLLSLLAAVTGASVWFVGVLGASDLWWHLAAGRAFFAEGAIPRVDTLSFSAAGRAWTNHEWLWGALAFALHRVSPELLALCNYGVLLATFGLAFEVARRCSGSQVSAVLACWLAAACAHFFLEIRPHVISLFFSVLWLATRERRWALWIWPPLIALWGNLHAGYLFGVGAVGLHALACSWPRADAPRGLAKRAWLLAALCVLATGLNPWGFQLLEYAATYAPGAQRSLFATDINEWQPLGFDPAELGFFGPVAWFGSFRGRYFALLMLAAAAALVRWRQDRYLIALGAVSVVMAFAAQRFVALSALMLTPLVASALGELAASGAALLPSARRALAALRTAAPALLCVGALWTWSRSAPFPDLFARWTVSDTAPRAAARYLGALETPLRVLNLETWGGYLSFHVPGAAVFIDGRANTVYDETIYRDYLSLMNGREVSALLAKYRPDAALVPKVKLASDLLALPRPWRLVYEDATALLLLSPDSAPLAQALPDPDARLGQEPQWLRRRAALAYAAGDRPGAMAWLQRALERDPLFLPAYTDLLAIVARHGDTQLALQTANAAIQQLPQREREIRGHLGFVYDAQGDRKRAAAALRSAVVAGPYDAQHALRARVERLEASD